MGPGGWCSGRREWAGSFLLWKAGVSWEWIPCQNKWWTFLKARLLAAHLYQPILPLWVYTKHSINAESTWVSTSLISQQQLLFITNMLRVLLSAPYSFTFTLKWLQGWGGGAMGHQVVSCLFYSACVDGKLELLEEASSRALNNIQTHVFWFLSCSLDSKHGRKCALPQSCSSSTDISNLHFYK